ncbi:MAG: molybdopterin-dependent oxidoreductase [Thermodesulfobacteriota bacterium]|nr:molybdopterin-dependent oxidoreductase [Thermodesulfobacteriota bacterium]
MKSDINWVKTHCARMDHGGCSILAGVKDNKIVKVKGDPDGFLNKGYICTKGLASPDRLTHPDRLKYPLKRVGDRGEGKWQRISWKEALEYTAENLNKIKEKYGPKGVAFGVGMPKGLEHFVLIRLANIFGSPNVVASQDVCHAPREVTGIHTCGFYPVADLHHKSKLILLWASNITSTNEEGEISSMLLEQVEDGTELVVIDPRRIDLVKKAKKWIQLRPGTDHALALGLLNVIIEESLYDKDFVEKWTYGFEDLASHVRQFSPEKISEITWVPPDVIRETARLYATSKPAVIQWGNPLEHNVHTFDAVRAIICLMAICGNLDIPGGNVNAKEPNILGLGPFVRSDLIPNKRKEMVGAYHGIIPRLMTVAPSFFKKAILEGDPYPVKGFYAMCANPMMSYAGSPQTYEAFMNLDFTAVADLFMTPTAAMADIVLPVASQFEMDDIGHYGLGHGFILARPKIVDPPEECWPDIKIMNELGKLISSKEYWHEDYNQFLEDVLEPEGITYSQFVEKGYLKGPQKFKLYEEKGFRTPTGKVELRLSTAEKFNLSPMPSFKGIPEDDDPEYPLILTSSKSRYYLHSSYRWIKRLRDKRPNPKVEIHPETATKFGIKEGDEVIVETRYGSMSQIAHLADSVDRRVINASHGWWFPEKGVDSLYDWQRANFNMLTSTEKLGKEFGTPNLKGLVCKITKK